MSADDIARFAFLAILGTAIGGSFIVSHWKNRSRMVQQASIWGLIFLGVIAAYGLWDDISTQVSPRVTFTDEDRIVVPQARDGHYYLTAMVNGHAIEFVIDTGATGIVLSQSDAENVGIDPKSLAYIGSANTANGEVRTASIRLETLTIGPISDTNVRAIVTQGEMFGSLLGMSYLSRYARIEIAGGELILSR